MVALSLFYKNGAGVDKDDAKARFWIEKARTLDPKIDVKKVAELFKLKS